MFPFCPMLIGAGGWNLPGEKSFPEDSHTLSHLLDEVVFKLLRSLVRSSHHHVVSHAATQNSHKNAAVVVAKYSITDSV